MSKVNGNKNMDTPQMEVMRQTVIEQELSARSWKAYYEKMYYSLEAEKLKPLYEEYQERAAEILKKEKEAMEQLMKNLNEEIKKKNQEDSVGEIKLEEAN